MKITEKNTIAAVPERVVDIEVGVECDLCGCRVVEHSYSSAPFGSNPYSDVPKRGRGNVNELVIEVRSGYESPEGGNITHTTYDVCPSCWRNEIATLFNNPPTVREVDF